MRTCCFIPCGKPAEFQITGTVYETEMDSCGDHVFDLASDDSCHVSIIRPKAVRRSEAENLIAMSRYDG